MKSIIIIVIISLPVFCLAQSADLAFHKASGQYIHEKTPEAKATLDAALKQYPNDKKLNELRAKIKDDEKKEQQKKEQEKKDQDQKKKEDQQKKDQEKKDQEQKNKDDQKKDQNDKDKDKKEQEKKDQEKKEQDKKEQEKKEQEKKDQEKKDQQNSDQKQDDKKKDDNKPSPEVQQKLQDMKISPEKAKMILNAMKNQEVQYLQQNKRKASKPKEKGKPDW